MSFYAAENDDSSFFMPNYIPLCVQMCVSIYTETHIYVYLFHILY